MLQSVGIELDESFREVTTDNMEKEIELLISPLVIVNNTTNSSDSSMNEVLNHHWTFYIEVRNIKLRLNRQYKILPIYRAG